VQSGVNARYRFRDSDQDGSALFGWRSKAISKESLLGKGRAYRKFKIRSKHIAARPTRLRYNPPMRSILVLSAAAHRKASTYFDLGGNR